jgi:hypothetical protein
MNEIVTDIFTGAWFSEAHGYNFNGYLRSGTAGRRGPYRHRADGRRENSAYQSQPFARPT